MVSGTLYTYPGSFRANKVLIAAAYSGADVKVDPNFEYGKTNTSDSFLKKFPLGKVPAFEDSNGDCLDEANAIAQYISNEALLGGASKLDQAKVRQYVEFAENEILPSACTWTFPTLGFKQYNKQDTEKAMVHIKKCLVILNDALLTQTFLVGERVTLADISLCSYLVLLYVQVLEPKLREEYGNVNRWFSTCINQPNFKKVLGEIKLCTKMATFDNARYQELHPSAKKGASKDKKQTEEKPKKAPKVEETLAVDEPKTKKVDHFANAPKSAFVLDDWKKTYSNGEDEAAVIEHLWKNFDKDAYSLWYGQYKFPEQLKKKYEASNLAGGFIQRIEGLRKHCIAVFNIFQEEDSKFQIDIAIMVRGLNNPFKLSEDWNVDAPSFEFRRLHADCAADRTLYEQQIYGTRPNDVICDACKEFK